MAGPANCGFVVAWSPVFAERFAGASLKNVSLQPPLSARPLGAGGPKGRPCRHRHPV